MSGFVLTPKDYPKALSVVGEAITVLASKQSSAGDAGYEVFLQVADTGTGPPPHHHPWDEAFFIIEGGFEFCIGGKTSTAKAGTFCHVPGGTSHWFRSLAPGSKMLSITNGGNAAAMFTAIDEATSQCPSDMGKVLEAAARHGLQPG